MARRPHHTCRCEICQREVDVVAAMPADLVRAPIAEVIRKHHPEWSSDGYICLDDLNDARSEWIQDVMRAERGELSELETQVIESIREHEVLTENINTAFDRQLTFGERVADRVAEFGGSWTFIGCFALVMLLWIVTNSQLLLARPFDPFPYILLNLVLSCLAALQAPVIMMSQNRQEDKDRLRSEHDYRVNLKAELEIRHLDAKLDLLLTQQWHRLLEIQQIQTDLLQEMLRLQSKR